jgi:hypothetical protein
MFRMQKRAVEKPSAVGDELELLRKMLTYLDGGSPHDEAPKVDTSLSEPRPAAVSFGDSLAEMKQLVSEQRSAAEALLEELGAIDRRLDLQSRVAEANRAYLAARENVTLAEAQLAAARQEALGLKERAEALRDEMLSMGESGTFEHVQELARQIAEFKSPLSS